MGAKCPTCGGRENVIVDGTSCQVRPDRFHREAREKFDREAAATPPAPAPAEDRDIWQHDETGRIVELPAGSPSPGKRYYRVRGMGGRVSVVGKGDEARVVFTPDAPAPADDASGAEAMREAFEAWWDGPKDGETMRPFGSGSKAHSWMVWQAARARPTTAADAVVEAARALLAVLDQTPVYGTSDIPADAIERREAAQLALRTALRGANGVE